jgi:hypothetical protein
MHSDIQLPAIKKSPEPVVAVTTADASLLKSSRRAIACRRLTKAQVLRLQNKFRK